MSRIPYPLCALAALVLFLAAELAPRADSSAAPSIPTASVPSHDSITNVLRAGLGSKAEKGYFDLFSTDPLHPVAWLYVTDSTADGDGTEYLITTSSYVVPGPLATSVALTKRYLGVGGASLQDVLDDIVAGYDHVDSTEDLEVVVRDVSPVLP